MKELTFNPQINVQQCVLWQYANSPALRTLLQAKSDFYEQNVTQFWNDWFNDVFNINTATDFGLTVWGEILDFPRQVKSNSGQIHILTTEQYRTILKGQLLKFRMDGTAPQINEWLNVVFGNQGNVYCLDNLDMTAIPFVFETNPSDEMLWLLSNVDFLPRPAGVGYEVRIVGEDVFGFNGSGLQPFNQGTFYKNWNQDLDIAQNQYQLSVNAPAGATVTINGITGNYQNMSEGTQYSYTVSRNGYLSFSGSGTLTQDTTINVADLVISSTAPDSNITLNDQEGIYGAYFLSGQSFAYSYSVSSIGYITQQGSGTATQSQTVVVNMPVATYNLNISGITASGNGTIQTVSSPYEGNYTITLKAEGGKSLYNQSGSLGLGRYDDTGSNSYGTGVANGGISVIKTYLPQGASLRFVKIAGWGYGGGNGGTGIALYIADELVAVSGGGGGGVGAGGGGGYVGGYWYSTFTDVGGYGYSIDFTRPTSDEANQQYGVGACGGFRNARVGSLSRPVQIYGGSSYANPSFNITQIAGGSTTTGNPSQGNYGEGSITIVYTGRD